MQMTENTLAAPLALVAGVARVLGAEATIGARP